MRCTVILACFAAACLATPVLGEPPVPQDLAVQDLIDQHIGRALRADEIQPAAAAGDLTLLRRTTLDLVGRIPTVSEARAYLASDDPRKRELLVHRLIGSPGFARHQADAFDAFLMYETSSSLRDYLRAAFAERRPWDEMFRDMLAAEGSSRSPAEEFVKARVKDVDRLTNDTSAIFFGVNVSCAKCHDHPLVPQWSQAHFYGMKSFFNRTFENGDFLGERDYGEVKYKTTSGDEKLAPLMFLTGAVIEEPAGKDLTAEEKRAEKKLLEELKKNKQPPPAPTFSRRMQLADAALRPEENRYFARAITNRVWYQLLGHALVMPLDQMHPENLGSHPELLDSLAADLIDHEYDLQRLIRGIVLSDVYARSSRWVEGDRPPPESFAVANLRPLGPFQYATTLRLATTNPDHLSPDLPHDEITRRIEAVEHASRSMADSFEQPREGFQIGVTEALLLNNNPRVTDELLRDTADSLVRKLHSLADNRQLIETAVWNVLVRQPDARELQLFDQFLQQHEDRRAGCQQLVWSLLASSEVRFNY